MYESKNRFRLFAGISRDGGKSMKACCIGRRGDAKSFEHGKCHSFFWVSLGHVNAVSTLYDSLDVCGVLNSVWQIEDN